MAFIKTLATAAVIAFMAVLSGIPGSAAEPLAPSSTATPMKLIPPPKRPTPHPETLQHRAKSEAKSEGKSAGTSHILRGAETYALIARLPWWRTVEMQTIPYPDKAFVSQALATADAWFATEFGGHGIASHEVIRIVDANISMSSTSPPAISSGSPITGSSSPGFICPKRPIRFGCRRCSPCSAAPWRRRLRRAFCSSDASHADGRACPGHPRL